MRYDFYCPECNKEKEITLDKIINEDTNIICECGNPMRVKISKAGGVIFKGKGFTKKNL